MVSGAGLGRGCATACSKRIYQSEGKGWSKSATFLLHSLRGLPGLAIPGYQDIRQMYLRRVCRSIKWPAYAPFDSPRNTNHAAGFTSVRLSGLPCGLALGERYMSNDNLGKRVLPVCAIYQDGKYWPVIRLQGRWLQGLGFKAGGRIKVEYGPGRLLIRRVP